MATTLLKPQRQIYSIGELATASTTDTQSNTLYQLWINDNSIPDQYGVTKGMTFEEVHKKTPQFKGFFIPLPYLPL